MRVCTNCNQTVEESVKFCPRCGGPQDAAMYGIRDYTAKRRPIGVFGKVTLCLLGLGMVFQSVRSILLKNFGVTTPAVVYRAEQQEKRDVDDRSDPTRFELSYRYKAEGETYEGSGTMYFEYGYVTEMGTDGKPIPKTAVVRYLPSIPSWSEIVSVPGGRNSSYTMGIPNDTLIVVILALVFAAVLIHHRIVRRK